MSQEPKRPSPSELRAEIKILREMCTVYGHADGPVKEVWVHQSGGNVYINYLVLRGGGVIVMSEDCLQVYRTFEDCIANEKGVEVPNLLTYFDEFLAAEEVSKPRRVHATLTYTKDFDFEVPEDATKEEIEQELDDADLSHGDYKQTWAEVRDCATGELISRRDTR